VLGSRLRLAVPNLLGLTKMEDFAKLERRAAKEYQRGRRETRFRLATAALQ